MIAAFGDSNTAGAGDAYPGLLAATLSQQFGPARFTVVNHGISGLTTDQLVTNLGNTTWLDENPDIALIMIGGNDLWPLLSSANLSTFLTVVQQAVDNVQAAVNLIATHPYSAGRAPKIVVSGYLPNKLPNVTFSGLSINPNFAIEVFNAGLADQLTGVDVYFTQNYDDILDPATQKARTSLMRDNLHLNQAGRQIVADNFAEVIVAIVPEPASGASLLLGAAFLFTFAATKRRRASASLPVA
ncbi:MAG: SGNH/GDSL hydrolase family protein [Pirellulales bacterium]|nr:SGNH/GDSL hydrolase family protein [Pirellulales bacterium]